MATGRGGSRPPGGADRDSGPGRHDAGRSGAGRPGCRPRGETFLLNSPRSPTGGGGGFNAKPRPKAATTVLPRPEPPRCHLGGAGPRPAGTMPTEAGPGRPRTRAADIRKPRERSWMPGTRLAVAGRSLFGRGLAAIAEPGTVARQRRSASASGLGAEGVIPPKESAAGDRAAPSRAGGVAGVWRRAKRSGRAGRPAGVGTLMRTASGAARRPARPGVRRRRIGVARTGGQAIAGASGSRRGKPSPAAGPAGTPGGQAAGSSSHRGAGARIVPRTNSGRYFTGKVPWASTASWNRPRWNRSPSSRWIDWRRRLNAVRPTK